MTETLKTTDLPFKRLRLADLNGASYNPRAISDEAFRALRDSLKQFGLLEVPVVNDRGDELRIVSGHQRVEALLKEGVEYADCIVVKLDDTAEKVANLSMNNPAIRGKYDPIEAVHALAELQTDALPRPDFAAFDKQIAEIREYAERLEADRGRRAGDAKAVDDKKKAKSKPGTVYKLGRHRVYCGDFRDGVTKILGPKKTVALTITDPPYNINLAPRSGQKIEGDDQKREEWEPFVRDLCEVILQRTVGPSYVFISQNEVASLQSAWEIQGGQLVNWAFWAKDTFSVSHGDYHHQFEPILVGVRDGDEYEHGQTLTNVIECPRPTANGLHPTQKPLPLIRALMEDSGEKGDAVLDLFAGSGSTLVMAEELGLTCYACEADPRYVDVIRRRYAEQAQGEDCDWVKATPALKK